MSDEIVPVKKDEVMVEMEKKEEFLRIPEQLRNINPMQVRKTELSYMFALYDTGLLKAIGEEEIALRHNMSVEQIQDFRRRYRRDIELRKDELFIAQKMIQAAATGAVQMRLAASQAIMNGDIDTANTIKAAAKAAEECLPTKDLVELMNLVKEVENSVAASAANVPQINIQVNNEVSKGDELMRKFRQKKSNDKSTS